MGPSHAAALVAVALLVTACLPRSSYTRRDELPSERYVLLVDITTRHDLVDTPFDWRWAGELRVAYARTFRDGSIGRLACFSGGRTSIVRDGATSPTASDLDGACVELRAFVDGAWPGDVLSVGPIGRWTGTGGHLELLDVVWPTLSPQIPTVDREGRGNATAAWPLNASRSGAPRARLTSGWALDRRSSDSAAYTWTGDLASTSGAVGVSGTASGELLVDLAASRVARHRSEWRRTVRVAFPTREVVQDIRTTVTLVYAGEGPPMVVAPMPEDDAAADASPLTLADGHVLEDVRPEPRETLPFLLLPDDAELARLAEVRRDLFDPATLPVGSP